MLNAGYVSCRIVRVANARAAGVQRSGDPPGRIVLVGLCACCAVGPEQGCEDEQKDENKLDRAGIHGKFSGSIGS